MIRSLLATALLLLSVTSSANAQTATAYKTGEQKTGSTTQCYYESLGRQYTRTVESYQLCPLSIQVPSAGRSPETPSTPEPAPRTITAYKTGERTTGSTKQCYYEGLGKEFTRTLESYQLCPLTIQVRQ